MPFLSAVNRMPLLTPPTLRPYLPPRLHATTTYAHLTSPTTSCRRCPAHAITTSWPAAIAWCCATHYLPRGVHALQDETLPALRCRTACFYGGWLVGHALHDRTHTLTGAHAARFLLSLASAVGCLPVYIDTLVLDGRRWQLLRAFSFPRIGYYMPSPWQVMLSGLKPSH